MPDRYQNQIKRLKEEIDRLQEEIGVIHPKNFITKQEFDSYFKQKDKVIYTEHYGSMRIDHFFHDGFAAYPIRKDGQRFKGPAGSFKYFYVKGVHPVSLLIEKFEQLKAERREHYKEHNKQQYSQQKERYRERAHELLLLEKEKNNGFVPRPSKRPLVLSYELTWRTDNKKSLNSTTWKILRMAILERDNYTCVFCGFSSPIETGKLQVNHIDGNPENNDFYNLETVCFHCHYIMHSGFSSQRFGLVEIYEHSTLKQEEIIRVTRELRKQGYDDDYIKEKCGLLNQVAWVQDHEYLSTKYGFVSSRKVLPTN